MTKTTWWRTIALVAVLALAIAACPADDDVAPPVDDNGDVEAPDDPDDVAFDIGVTSEPCPDGDPDRGCIYLGSITDLTGPFSPFGQPITMGQEAFWARVNANGGIGGLFDVHMGDHIRDAEYVPETHVREYSAIRDDVAALTQTLGTSQTLAASADMVDDDMVGAVLTWWSGWEFEEYNHILQTGSNYCIDAMNGLEWAEGEYGISSVITVFFPNDYGRDADAGVEYAAGELGIDVLGAIEQIPVAAGGEVSGAVGAILSNQPDAVFLTVGPTETAQIIGGSAAQGYQGRFISSHPGYFGALLQTEAAPALIGLMNTVGPHENWGGDSDAHRAMQEQLGEGNEPPNDGFTFGWMAAYPILAVLEHAVEQGDLTRAGIRAAVEQVTVDFEGAMPDKQYGADPNETVQRSTAIGVPDPEGSQGLTTIDARYEGSVAADFDFTEPCAPAG
jgi:ABC-type branched-subunit amino acid transport system substrate-binding protein